jgi:membrane protein YqaA with SNARE-associated domain
MSIATLFGIAALGTLFWLASPEAAVALFASKQQWNPVVIAAVAASGQAVSVTLLFLFGSELRRRWRWFDRQCERVRTRFGNRMARNAVVASAVSGLLGLPPLSVAATLAPGLAPRPAPLLPLMIGMRFVRFVVLGVLVVQWGFKWPW